MIKIVKIEVVKEFSFDAAHFLPNHKGQCKEVHGHHWVLKIGVKGNVNKNTGMVMDFADIKKAVQQSVIDKLDHKFLNEIKSDSFPSNQPTSENIIKWILEQFNNFFAFYSCYTVELNFIRLYETPASYAEWRRE